MEEWIEAILRGGRFKQIVESQVKEIRKEYELKQMEIDVLFALAKRGNNNTSADICRHLRANKGHVSQTVESLRSKKLLIERQDEKDRRYMHYYLTREADEIIQKVSQKWDELNSRLFKGILPEEIEVFNRVSEQIARNMEAF